MTVTVKLPSFVLPAASVARYVTVLVPIGNAEPEAKPAKSAIDPPGALSVNVGVE